MPKITVTIEGNIKSYMAAEAAAVFAGARQAVRLQTEETKNQARAVVNAGLSGSTMFRGGNRRAAQTIRSQYYADTPAGFVYSSWGYFEGGKFRDILAAHTYGMTIVPRRGKWLFIPFIGAGSRGARVARSGLQGEKVDLIPTRNGLLVVTRVRGQKRGLPLGILLRQVRIPKRLDFGGVEQRAETGLAEKTLAEIERAGGS